MDKFCEDFKTKYHKVYDADKAELLDRILTFADCKHKGQTRASGEPYIDHPVAVADILLDLGLDSDAVGAAILHDTIEDTSATESELYSLFGEEITTLVMGVTKLAKYTFSSKEDEAAENFRRMYFAMAKDIRVILIKLADRLHNMRTIFSKPIERRKAIATETLEIYTPLASRLGLSYIKCEMEDLCLEVLKPDVYAMLREQIPLKRAERQELVNKICKKLEEMLDELHVKGEVSGRPKHFYSIYKKMERQNKTFDQIYDLTAVRVIVSTVKDCYEVLGMIHTVWKPIPGRFKDYISVPKPNNYQSLHTTVMTSYGMPFEIQIRTYEMHRIAEYGIAAHWLYKENRRQDELDKKIEWLRGVMDVQNDSVTPQEFYESLKFDLYSSMVYVFTPKGDVIALPMGSTPIDFAYNVHTQIGNNCIGAKINGKEAPLETKLTTGDYVEIIVSETAKGPSRDWLRIVKSTQAKTKIKAYFKRETVAENVERGRVMLENEAKSHGYKLDDLMQQKWLDIIMKRYSLSSLDDLYASLGYGGYTVNQILLKLIDFYKRENAAKNDNKNSDRQNSSGVIVMGHNDVVVHMAKCCNPVPGDEIIGYMSRNSGIAIHCKNCANIANAESDKLVAASWEESTSQFTIALEIETKNTAGLLAEVTKVIYELNLFIVKLVARADKHNNGIIDLSIRADSMTDIDKLKDRISTIKDVEKIYRLGAKNENN